MDIEAWIRRAQHGDAGAFNQLVDVFQGLAYHVALHHVGRVPEYAEDACQEAMLSAWQAIGRFQGDARAFRAWLIRIVINACRDKVRHERRRPHEPIEAERDGELWEMPLPDPGQSPEAYAANADLLALLSAAVERLSAEHREVILLDHAGFNYAEMATILEVEIGTVKSRLSRARQVMRALLTGERDPDVRSRGRGAPPGVEPDRLHRRSEVAAPPRAHPTDREPPPAPGAEPL